MTPEPIDTPERALAFLHDRYPHLLGECLAEHYDEHRKAWPDLPPLELACRWDGARHLRFEASPPSAAAMLRLFLEASWEGHRKGFLAVLLPDQVELGGFVGVELVGCAGGPVTFPAGLLAPAAQRSPPS